MIVIIPVYNPKPEQLNRLLYSIDSQIGSHAIILINDKGDDITLPPLNKTPYMYVRNTVNMGQGCCRLLGIKLSEIITAQSYITFADQDDYFYSNDSLITAENKHIEMGWNRICYVTYNPVSGKEGTIPQHVHGQTFSKEVLRTFYEEYAPIVTKYSYLGEDVAMALVLDIYSQLVYNKGVIYSQEPHRFYCWVKDSYSEEFIEKAHATGLQICIELKNLYHDDKVTDYLQHVVVESAINEPGFKGNIEELKKEFHDI